MKKATIKDDGYEIHAGFRIRLQDTKAGKRYQVDLGRKSGRHVRKNFKILQEARNWAHLKSIEAERKGIGALKFSDEQKADAVEALELLGEFDANLRQAAAFYVKHHQKVSRANRFGSLVDQYLAEQKARVGKGTLRPATLEDAKKRLGRFSAEWERLAITTIEAKDIDALLDSKGYHGTNRQNYKRYLSGFFNWAIKQEKTKGNPVQLTETVRISKETPEIYIPRQVKEILRAAEKGKGEKDPRPELVPYLAIAFFAGVRPEEISRLCWEDIDLNLGEIHIRSAQSKTHSARLVHVSDNLKAWLLKYRQESGRIFSYSETSLKRWRAQVMKTAGVRSIQDGARHTFATFHLALHGIDDTLQELGHTDPKMLFRHYRGLAKNRKAQAIKYFQIEPAEAGKIIPMQKAGAA
jgi:integrase